MVLLQLSQPIPAVLKTELPIRRLACRSRGQMLKKPSSSTGLCMSNARKSESQLPLYPPLDKSVAAVVFGDGSESGLYPLTKRRSEGAIPIGANYRLIDIVVSNCINSNITKIYALTQLNSTSLNSHLARAYSSNGLGKDGFVEVLAADQSYEDQDWFQGSADAIRRFLCILEEHPVMDFLVLPGHHLYRMDYQKLIQAHRDNNADITIAVSCATRNQNASFGFAKVDSQNQVLELKEKLKTMEQKPMKEKGSSKLKQDVHYLGSMGIYVIKRDVMMKLLTEYFPKANDFLSEVIAGAISMGMKVQSYTYDGYWEDMGSIEAFYQANIESTRKKSSAFNFYDRHAPLYTLPRYLPPTMVSDAVITESVIGDGCVFDTCKIDGSVIGMRTRIRDGAVVEDSVVMGSDIYQVDDVQSRMAEHGNDIPIGIGEQSYIRKAIIDKNARIGKNVRIMNADCVKEGSREDYGYFISGGIVIVHRNAVIPDGSIL
ncbi:hypothetical protein AAC387_Pa01g4359 [Persea americana]